MAHDAGAWRSRVRHCRWRAGREEAEQRRVLCDPHHYWINLEERPLLALIAMAGETAGAEANDGHLGEHPARSAGCLNGVGKWSAKIVVTTWLRSSENEIAE